MNKYVFITYSIAGVGGGQIYCRNKACYCNDQGFRTYVFSTVRENILIEDLKNYKELIKPELRYAPQAFPRKIVDDIVQKMLLAIDYHSEDNVLIESNLLYGAMWGELLAEKCKAKHWLFLLDESYGQYADYIMEFLNFKLMRRELAGINRQIIRKLFTGYVEPDADLFYELSAVCSNSTEDIENTIDCSALQDGCKVIGIIGRLEKPYVIHAVQEVIEFLVEKREERFGLLVIGGGSTKHIRKIEHLAHKASNVNVIVSGYLYPVPRKLLCKMDVCIANSGSANMAYMEDIPTIVADAYSDNALGILGYNTKSTLMPEGECIETISYYLNQILYEDFTATHKYIPAKKWDQKVVYELFERHFEFINQSVKSKQFYDVMKKGGELKEQIMRVIYRIGGCRLLQFIQKIYDVF